VACLNTFSQSKDSSYVTFITKFDKSRETKEGYNINGYVVDISRKKAQKLDGKKIRISGKVSIQKGLDNDPQNHNDKETEVTRGGRATDTKYILAPKIEIIH